MKWYASVSGLFNISYEPVYQISFLKWFYLEHCQFYLKFKISTNIKMFRYVNMKKHLSDYFKFLFLKNIPGRSSVEISTM